MRHSILSSMLASAAIFSSHSHAQDVTASIEFLQSQFSTDRDITVELTLKNNEKESVDLLTWLTGENGVKGNIFEVLRDGEPVPYLGALFKRRLAESSDYLTLRAGQQESYTLELSGFYDFSQAGQYEVSYNVETTSLFKNSDKGLKSNSISAWVEESKNIVESNNSEMSLLSSNTFSVQNTNTSNFTGCNNSQKSTINNAWASAKTLSTNALSFLIGKDSNTIKTSSRYTTWFGDASVTDPSWSGNNAYQKVKENFTQIKDAVNNKALSFDCNCSQGSDNTFAYVYKNQPYKIYLCSVFWKVPMVGTDSQAGTLIHEVSHFNVVSDTSDHAYGHTNSKQLAKTDPKKAVDNADSHEYFAENTPYLD